MSNLYVNTFRRLLLSFHCLFFFNHVTYLGFETTVSCRYKKQFKKTDDRDDIAGYKRSTPRLMTVPVFDLISSFIDYLRPYTRNTKRTMKHFRRI